MGALVGGFGIPESWRRVVPAAAIPVSLALLFTLVTIPPAQATPVATLEVDESQTPEAPAVADEPLTAADAVSAAAIARLTNEPVEILAERTEFGSVLALPNGSLAAGQGSGPVWVRQGGDGTAVEDWAAVDLTLEFSEDGLVRPVAQSADLVLSGGSATDGTSPSSDTAGKKPSFASPSHVAADVEPSPSSSPSRTPGTPASADLSAHELAPPPVEVASVTDPTSGLVTRIHWEGTLPEPRLEGRRAIYEAVEPGVDLVIEATSTGFEQFFVVHRRPAPDSELTFPLTVSTDAAEITITGDGGLSAHTDSGDVISGAPAPYMWDADSDAGRAFPVTKPRPAEQSDAPRLSPMPDFDNPHTAQGSNARNGNPQPDKAPGQPAPHTTIVGDGRIDPRAEAVEVERDIRKVAANQVEIDLAPTEEFLQSPETIYPLVIDPDVNLGWGFDTYVQSGYSDNRSEEGELRAGTYNGGTNIARSFIHFPMGQFAGATVYSARLHLFNFYSWSCQARNWEVWNTYPAFAGVVWANQPGWAQHFSTSSDTHGYSSSCGGDWSNADITAFAQKWAADRETEGHVGIKAENEGDNYGWKRFYASNYGAYIPSIWVNYNHAPAVPTGLRISDAPAPATSGTWTNNLTPVLSATLSDPDGGNVDGNFYLRNADTGAIIRQPASGFVPSGSVGSVRVDANTLQNGKVYWFTVRGSDWVVEGSESGQFWFGVDTSAPLTPTVSSTDYPNNNTWNKDQGQPGTFSISPSAPDASITGYRWGLNKAPDPNQVVAGGNFSVTPPTVGRHVLQVQAVDRAGNVSGIVKYAFNVGVGGILTPEDGARVVNRARLSVTARPQFTHARFEWRRGPDSGTFSVVPSAELTTSQGTSWTQAAPSTWGIIPLTSTGYTVWNVGEGAAGGVGPVQVRAVVALDSAGNGAQATGWVTLTVDPNATGAANADVGPGNVNLLTGDHNLAVTDAEEFGLAVVRSASSRNTDSGYQLQIDKLSQEQREATAIKELNGSAVVTVDTTRFHTGTTSYKIAPNGQADSYTGFGNDAGALRLGMLPGRAYRISAWIYVPAATGLQPENPRGLSLAVFTRIGSGAYSEPISTGAITQRPTLTNAWQQISVDVSIPSGATEAFVRMYNGFSSASKPVYFDDLSVRELWSPFGKEWSTGTVDESSGSAYTHISRPYDDVAAVHLTGGGEVWFTSGDGVKWWPEPGAEDLALTSTSSTTWRLTETGGSTTDFTRDPSKATDFAVSRASAPGATGVARHVYDVSTAGQSRLSRIIAPIEDGVDGWPTNANACNPAIGVAPARGCEVLELTYSSSTTATGSTLGSIAGRVESIAVWTTDPGDALPAVAAVRSIPVARYLYDTSGRLTKVWDPRIGTSSSIGPGQGTQVTTYMYDTAGRVTSVAAPGEEPFRFTYGKAGSTRTGSGDLLDSSSGRLLNVARRSLVPGSVDQWGPDNVSSVVYGVPLTRDKGGPYDLAAAQLATWAQQDGPTDATAVFGPQDVPSVATATSTMPGRDGYKPATVHYLNADGKEVNTASPTGAGAPVEGFIDTAEYDRFGNVVRSLDATNRLLALGRLPESADLASWGLGGTGSVYLSQVLDTRRVFSADGMDELASRGPAQQLAVANSPDQLVTMHSATRNGYDNDKPDGQHYHLVTRTRIGGIPIGADPLLADYVDSTLTTYGFAPVDGASATGPTSGWVHRQATRITIDAEQPTALTSTVVYDTKGRPLRSSKPGSNGNDAATTVSVLYTAGTNASDAPCGNRPEWAGQPCMTTVAGAVAGHDPTRAATNLPIKRVDAYNRFGSPSRVSESATGPIAGTSVTQKRTTNTEHDAADRVISVQITGTGTGVGAMVQRSTTVYDELTGEVTENRSVDGTGAVTAAVTKSFDKLGRLVSYTDGAGATTTTRYDRYGQPSSATDSVTDGFGTRTIGSTQYNYDRDKDPRGYVTSFTDSVAGTFEAEWGPDGQLQTQTLPGGVALTISYDPARVPVRRTYTRASDGVVIASDSVVENHRGQWVRHTSDTGVRNYEYDRFGRLTKVQDQSAASRVCTTRTYGFASTISPASANRTSFGTASAEEGQPCVDPANTSASTYDSADRLVTSPGRAGSSWRHDPLGRVTSMAITTAGGEGSVSNDFYVNDLIASQTQHGVEQMAWGLDPLQRRSTFTSKKWVNDAWASAITKVSHYGSDSDEPLWIQEDSTLPSDVTRYVAGVEGDLAITTTLTGGRTLNLVDLHGDVTATLPIADGATNATWQELSFTSFDEFGVPQQMSGAGSTTGPPARYGWLGAAQRSAEALGGVILMGVRLYSAPLGRFLSVDPVAGGSASAYDYCNADPVNCTDLAGTFSWKGALKTLAVVGEVASMIPGPIGAAAAGVSAVAYAAVGDKKKALMMAATVALALVGAGAVVAVGAKIAGRVARGGQLARNQAATTRVLRTATIKPFKSGAGFTRASDRLARSAAVGKACPTCGKVMTQARSVPRGGRKDMQQVELDHIVPRSKGGNNSPWNRQAKCARCNNIKGNRI